MSALSTPIPPFPGLSIESDETVWDGRFPLHRVRFRNRQFDGDTSGPRTWELWRRGMAAAILPYDPARDVFVLVEQFRLPALAAGFDPVVREAPAGLCEPGEDAEVTVRRELEEETGLRATAVLPIGDFLLSPGGMDEHCALFLGRVVAPETAGRFGLVEEQEDIRIVLQPAAEAVEDALSGRVSNASLAVALLWFGLKRDQVRRDWGAA